jgi:hypothetical protein
LLRHEARYSRWIQERYVDAVQGSDLGVLAGIIDRPAAESGFHPMGKTANLRTALALTL